MTESHIAMPVRAPSSVTMADLDRIIERPYVIPAGTDVQPMGRAWPALLAESRHSHTMPPHRALMTSSAKVRCSTGGVASGSRTRRGTRRVRELQHLSQSLLESRCVVIRKTVQPEQDVIDHVLKRLRLLSERRSLGARDVPAIRLDRSDPVYRLPDNVSRQGAGRRSLSRFSNQLA